MELDVILLRKENIKYIIHKIASPNEYTIYLKGLQGGYDREVAKAKVSSKKAAFVKFGSAK
jgi:hypothetical protein